MQNDSSSSSAVDGKDDPANRRRYRRKPVIWSAQLETAHGPISCVTLEVSVGGAKLRLLEPIDDTDDRVTLHLEKFGALHAHIAWRRAPEVGLQFELPPAEIAERFGGILPFDAPVDESVLSFELVEEA